MRKQVLVFSDNIREAESHFLPLNYTRGNYNMRCSEIKSLSLMERTLLNTPYNEAQIRGYAYPDDAEVFLL